MTLELRQLYPPGGTFKYKAYPAPAIETGGSFFWVLSAGEYQLLGNPRLLGSERFTLDETEALARFGVPASGGTIYLGTLIISIVQDLSPRGRSEAEARYAIHSRRVVAEREQALSQLRARFPVFPDPVVSVPMRAE